jgi:hypothetical protein
MWTSAISLSDPVCRIERLERRLATHQEDGDKNVGSGLMSSLD